MALLAVVVAAIVAGVASCNKEEETVTYTDGSGLARVRGVELVFDTVPPDSVMHINMVLVRAGSFQMGGFGDTLVPGAPERQWEWDYSTPSHNVVLEDDFYISQTEVTQRLFRKVLGYNPSRFNVGDDYPVENVTYAEAVRFCDSLSARSGKTFSLPTEAQWEYAARGGHLAPKAWRLDVLPVYPVYPGGNGIDSLAWYRENADSTTHPVAQKLPNALGLYDMSGNVREWVSDYWSRYTPETQHDPTGPLEGTNRVIRGGSWLDYDRYCRTAFRIYMDPSKGYPYVGFRIVRRP